VGKDGFFRFPNKKRVGHPLEKIGVLDDVVKGMIAHVLEKYGRFFSFCQNPFFDIRVAHGGVGIDVLAGAIDPFFINVIQGTERFVQHLEITSFDKYPFKRRGNGSGVNPECDDPVHITLLKKINIEEDRY
jgi:hypothetical protein